MNVWKIRISCLFVLGTGDRIKRKKSTNWLYVWKHSSITTMNILQSVQKDLASMGYKADQSRFNNDILAESLKYVLFIACECVYLYRFDGATKDLAFSVIMTTIGIAIFISFISTVLKMEVIFMFINGTEKSINDSVLDLIYINWFQIWKWSLFQD